MNGIFSAGNIRDTELKKGEISEEDSIMLLTAKKTSVIGNYLVTIILFMMASLGLSEVYTNPARLAQQGKISNYALYINADIVLKSQNAWRW